MTGSPPSGSRVPAPGQNTGHTIERILYALGDPTRRTIVEMLSSAPRSVSTLAAALGITLTAVGQHLQVLEECRLARSEKLGRVRTCSLDVTGLNALAKWVQDRKPPIAQSLDRLGELLAEEEPPRGGTGQNETGRTRLDE